MKQTLAGLLLLISALCVAQNPRVFITDSKSWEVSGSAGGSGGAFGGQSHGGARPQTAEIIKTFGERCPNVIINSKPEKADYVVLLDHEGGKGFARKDNKVAVFNAGGDAIVSRSTRSLGNAVKEACEAIAGDWKPRSAGEAASVAPAPEKTTAAPAPEFTGSKVQISSEPDRADIEVDGNFVGSTPSALVLAPGDHVVKVTKAGFKAWERKIKITGGAINLAAELEKLQ